MAELQKQGATVESLLAQIPPELLEVITRMNESGVCDESILSQIPAELLEMINRMNESGGPDENLLSQIPEALITLINRLNESQTFSAPATPTEIDQPISPRSVESETPQDVFGELENCLIHLAGDGLDRRVRVVYRNKFNNTEIRQFFNFLWVNQNLDYALFYMMITDTLNDLLETARDYGEPRDVLQLELCGDSLHNTVSLILPNGEADLEQFTALLERLVQSNFAIIADRTLELVVQIIRQPQGGGGQRRKLDSLMQSEILSNKRAYLINVHNPDNKLCFAIGLAHLLNPGCTDLTALQKAREIQTGVGLGIHEGVAFSDIFKFENLLNIKIVVLYHSRANASLLKFQNTPQPHPQILYFYVQNEHYYAITNITAFLGTPYVCPSCHTGYTRKGGHSCRYNCSVCQDAECPMQPLNLTPCADCHRTCRSTYCYAKHKIETWHPKACKSVSICAINKKCPKCHCNYNLKIDSPKPHVCGIIHCPICKGPLKSRDAEVVQEVPHECYIQPLAEDEHSEKYVFYDFETNQQSGDHLPIFVSTMTFKGEKWSAEGSNCALLFLKHFRKPQYRNFTFIAHNARAYDSYLLLNPLIQQGVAPWVIAQGSKILCFVDPAFNQRYIDSLSFLPMRLAQMPEALGFENSVKGWFPHFFTSDENLHYVGAYPSPEMYGCDQMSPKERERFMTWYETVRHGTFDFHKEMESYCDNDVVILREGCLRFREEVIKDAGIDPWSCTTIASACMKTYRTHYLPPASIAIPSPDNYRRQFKSYSSGSIQWLEYMAQDKDIFIQHALNRGEKAFGSYHVDGYTQIDGVETAYEYNGCFFHGCKSCFVPQTLCVLTQKTFGEMYQEFQDKVDSLQATYGLKVVVLWEHEWTALKKSDPNVQAFLSSFETPEPLEPRQALYGGRTNALTLRYVAQPDETIGYVDFTSLYPHVMSSSCYPIGHPEIIHRDFDLPQNYFGLIKATVYPPRGLFIPVLPYRGPQGKLFFPLCRTCSENIQQTPCDHSDQERALTGVWVTVEFSKALEMGYRVAKIFEVWNFTKKSDTLFKEYIKTFLRCKQMASGYPASVTDQESKDRYIQDYHDREGILLDPDRIEVNKTKRNVSKLYLNSLWGKLAQRCNMLTTSIIKDPEEFLEFVFSDQYEISHFSFLSQDIALVQWRRNKKWVLPPGNVNVFLAAFTTAYGRLELYKLMEQLQRRVLYHDTDSVVYVSKPGDWIPPLSNYLGGLTSELAEGDHITEWSSCGPKSYAFRTKDNHVVLKAKGVTQNYENAPRVNLESITRLVEGFLNDRNSDLEILSSYKKIVRDKKGFHLRNAPLTKRFRVVYDKRRLLPDGTTLPYGY
ncbi:uncharacterized protein LOC110515264 [Oncorhynchus mykiss]|uniref:uncharacterized protein LOC110515264 n=1 Tax=Oncorhynchus mykiss TaxID=8022 RepID=UPI001877AF12|nr:uncharacterized protein LOC110515264 [Oncorhynchus mykiss]XP_036820430.1 uncharacterized protein LOC110515264 [Oncorhynchus mykiss]